MFHYRSCLLIDAKCFAILSDNIIAGLSKGGRAALVGDDGGSRRPSQVPLPRLH